MWASLEDSGLDRNCKGAFQLSNWEKPDLDGGGVVGNFCFAGLN